MADVNDPAAGLGSGERLVGGTREGEAFGTAANGQIALTKVEQLAPDLVTMDIEMPVMDGIEAVRQLRRSGCRVPIIMFSTLTEREHEVALAVARGRSNAEIAETLFMSVATVKSHVGRLFTKLGVENRVQVAICVHDAGL